MPKLIITADDCGLTDAINQLTYELHLQAISARPA